MNILFINPNIDLGGYKPLAISLLTGLARSLNHNVRLFDTSFINTEDFNYNQEYQDTKQAGEEILTFKPVDLQPYNIKRKKVNLEQEFLSVVEEFKPNVIALSIFSQEYSLGMALLKMAKDSVPDILTIVGGIHCYVDEKIIENEQVDFVCVGEGENVFKDFLQCAANGEGFSGIKGLFFKDEKGIHRSQPEKYVNLNDLPYHDYDDYDDRLFVRAFDGKVYRSADISLTRGCFEKCIYCLHKKIYDIYNSSRIRRYDIDRFIAELEFLVKRHRLDFIRFHDSTFLSISEKYLSEFAAQYIDKIGLPFVIDSTPQNITVSKVKLLKAMNCQSISIGVETGNESYRLKYLNKRATNNHILSAFKTINEHNIRTVSFILLGFPFETRKLIFETIDLIRAAKVSTPTVGFVYPFIGSQLREMVVEQGFFDESKEINHSPQYTRNSPSIVNPNISIEEYKGIHRTFLLYCKFSSKYFEQIRIAESFSDAGNKAYQELRELYGQMNLYNNYL
jgi:anaerobic magnesium-protoporphyrin IX monomethyl ester cyclase